MTGREAGDETAPEDADDGFVLIRRLAKGGGIVFTGLFIELGVSFFGKLLIARELGRVNYGAVSLGIITATIGTQLLLLGLDTAVGRYLPRDDSPTTRRSVLASAFRVAVPFSLLAAVVLIVITPAAAGRLFDDPSLVPILRIFALAIPFGIVIRLSVGGSRGMQDALPKVLIQNLTLPLTRFIGIIVALLLGLGAVGISFAYVGAYVVGAIGGLYYLYTRTPLFDFEIPIEWKERELLAFSLPVVTSGAMALILSHADMYLIGIFKGTGEVGVYNVAYPLAQLMMIVITSVGFLFLPIISELDANDEGRRMKQLYQLTTKWVVVATFPLFVLLFAFPEWIITYSFGAEYGQGAVTLSVLSVGFFIHTSFGANRGTMTSLGHTRILMYDDIAAAVTNIALNLMLIPEYGILGAAWATTASYVLLNTLYSVQLYRRTGIHPFARRLFVAPLLGGVTVSVAYLLTRSYFTISLPSLIAVYSVFLLAYGVAVLRFSVDAEEIRLLLSAEERFGVDLGRLKWVAKLFL